MKVLLRAAVCTSVLGLLFALASLYNHHTFASAPEEVSTSPVQVLSSDNNYFLKVNIRDSRVKFRVALANNDSGGLQTLAGIKGRFENQGYAEWAIVNGDLFGPGCSGGVNCAQGLTYIDGAHKPNWSAYGTGDEATWHVRGNLGLDPSKNVQISVGGAQAMRHMTIAGGPRVLMGGGSPTCNPIYDDVSGKVFFPDSGEWFEQDALGWCDRTDGITMVGYSADGQYLYMGISKGGKTPKQLAQWLKDRGAHEILRLDSGSSTGMYHNGSFVGGTGSKPIANAFVLIVEEEIIPPKGTWHAKYYDGRDCWNDTNCNKQPSCEEDINSSTLDKNWGSGAPCGMDGDEWVGDFRATINFPSDDYVFLLENDDGAKLWLNDQNIQDRGGSGSDPVCPPRQLSGDENLRLLFREDGGNARVKLTWTTDTSVCRPPGPNPPTPISPPNGTQLQEGEDITLSWTSTGNQYYAKYWELAGTIDSDWIKDTSWHIGPQRAGYTYSWHVKARNAGGVSDWSDTWSFTVKPARPTNLTATAGSCNKVNLSWSDNSDHEEVYQIYRNGSFINRVEANITSYRDDDVREDTTYTYYVKAFRSNIGSDPSNTATVTTPPCVSPADPYEPDNNPSQSKPIGTEGAPQTHNFHVAGDNDWVKFNASANSGYLIETANLGPNSDTYMYLYDQDGSTIITADDDGGNGYASRIEWTALQGGTYYVRVLHYSSSAFGSGTNYDLSIRTEAPPCNTPGTPTLISPADGRATNDSTPTFDWSEASNANEYQLQVDNDSDFSSPEIDIRATTSNYAPPSALRDRTTHYWRVRGHYEAEPDCDVWGSWSDVWSVNIDVLRPDDTPPTISNIIKPVDPICDSIEFTIRADVYDESDLDWVRLYYRLQGDSWQYKTMGWETGITHKATIGPFNPGVVEYYVKARDIVGNEAQSSQGVVSVDVCNCDPPGKVVLVSPGYGSTITDTTPAFVWDTSANSTEYQLQVADSVEFTTLVLSTTVATNSHVPTAPLQDGVTYYWRVRGHNASDGCGVYGPWSSKWSVTIRTIDTTIPFCPTPAADSCVDFGDSSDEAYHNLIGWGSSELGGTIIPPSKDPSKRRQLLQGDNYVDLFVSQANSPYVLLTEVEDGGCDDSFALYVNGHGPLYTYHAKPEVNAAVSHVISIPASVVTSTTVTINYKNVASDACGLAAVFNANVTMQTWRGEYFNNANLSGSPTIVRPDTNIDFDWGAGSPDPSIPPDYFSVRWTRNVDFETGVYSFTTTTDDGVKLYVDDSLLINEWHVMGATSYSATIALSQGTHPVKMEYFEENGKAVAKLQWSKVQELTDCNNVTEIPQSECEALVALYNSSNGDGWQNNTGWMTNNTPCSWYGITCESGHVSDLRLPNNRMQGSLPAAMGSLTYLKKLHLHFNQLTGSIPSPMTNLIKLEVLYLDRSYAVEQGLVIMAP